MSKPHKTQFTNLLKDRLSGDGLRRICGELSPSEERKMRILLGWVSDMAHKYAGEAEAAPPAGSISPEEARRGLRKGLARVRQSHPSSAASAALRAAESELSEILGLHRPDETKNEPY